MKLKLFSDFRDYYDHMFDISGEPFLRFSIDMLTKREQLILLTAVGYKVPQHGILEDLFNAGVGEKFVVYYKPILHAGKGKTILHTQEENPASFYQMYAAEFIIPDYNGKCKSTRILNIGNRQFQIDYESADDYWRSNVGSVTTQFVKELDASELYKSPLVGRALWAIDFVNFYTNPVAVDLNTSPAIPKELKLPASQVVDLIKDSYGF